MVSAFLSLGCYLQVSPRCLRAPRCATEAPLIQHCPVQDGSHFCPAHLQNGHDTTLNRIHKPPPLLPCATCPPASQLCPAAGALLPAMASVSVVKECTVVVTPLQRNATQLRALLCTGPVLAGPTVQGRGWCWWWRRLGAWLCGASPVLLDFGPVPPHSAPFSCSGHSMHFSTGKAPWSGSSLARQGMASGIRLVLVSLLPPDAVQPPATLQALPASSVSEPWDVPVLTPRTQPCCLAWRVSLSFPGLRSCAPAFLSLCPPRCPVAVSLGEQRCSGSSNGAVFSEVRGGHVVSD